MQKILNDNPVSLHGHVKKFEETIDEMLAGFHRFEEEWNNRLNDMKSKTNDLKELRLY